MCLNLVALKLRCRANDRVLVKHCVHDGCTAVRGIDYVDLAVLRLDSVGIGERVVATGDVASMGVGLVVVHRNGHRQRGPVIHVVVVDQQQVTIVQLDEVHSRVRVLELDIACAAIVSANLSSPD